MRSVPPAVAGGYVSKIAQVYLLLEEPNRYRRVVLTRLSKNHSLGTHRYEMPPLKSRGEIIRKQSHECSLQI